MKVKVTRADGFVEVFETNSYMLTTIKALHPAILKAEVFADNGKRIAYVKRPFSFIYKHFTFKPEMLNDLLKQSEKDVPEPPEATQNIEEK